MGEVQEGGRKTWDDIIAAPDWSFRFFSGLQLRDSGFLSFNPCHYHDGDCAKKSAITQLLIAMPVPDQVRDDGSGTQGCLASFPTWMPVENPVFSGD
jgi:hypothetical protein